MLLKNATSEGLIDWLYEQSHIGIITLDKNFKILFINQWVESNVNLPKELIIGSNLFRFFPDLNKKQILSYLEMALNGQVSVLSHRFHKYLLPIPLQKSVFANLDYMQQTATISPLISNKQISGVQIVIEDVTDRVAREMELSHRINKLEEIQKKLQLSQSEIVKANKELNAANAEKDKFFSIIAHDLTGPLGTFQGLTQIMDEELDSLTKEDVQRIAKMMNTSANNLSGLLKNLLEWSRMKRGSIPFDPRKLNLSAIVEDTLKVLKGSFEKKNIRLQIDIKEDIVVYADQNMLHTIIRNLVSNALKFTINGGLITISTENNESNTIAISVKDTGIGMKKEMVDNLFRIDIDTGRPGTNDEPSTGLGLQFCKEFVEKHGGTIWVESEEGKGSNFKFTIPIISQ